MQSIVSHMHTWKIFVYLRGATLPRVASNLQTTLPGLNIQRAALNNVEQQNLWITLLWLAFEQKFRSRGMK
jgi:hypothetical protein